MWKATFVVFCCGLLAVKGDISELDNITDQDPIRIGAFNIQNFGETKFENPEVVQELVKILSRYDIVLVQEIRDSSQNYIYKLVEKLNNKTRSDEPFSLVVSERLGRSSSKEQYAFLYRKKYVNIVEVYQYEDPLDLFQRPPYAAKFYSDVLDTMHEYGIIGLHTSPEDAFIEINALSVVYAEVERRFKTPHILIAGDLNADCSYLSRTKMKELSIRNDTTYKWLIDDYQDTTVSGTNCAYDRFIIKKNTWPDIIPDSVQVFHYENEHLLTKEVALAVSDHYPIEMELKKYVPEIETVQVEKGLPVITIAYIITVPGILILCVGVNFITYKWGMKKGQKKERKRFLLRSQENTQAVDYQHYFNDDENFTLQSFNTEGHPGTSSAYRFKESQDPSHDYADYDEIKDQKLEAKWRDEKGYSTAEFRSLNRPLPPIKAEENDYMSPGDELPLEQRNSSTSNDSSSPPGNGGYLSPLQEEKEAEERLVSNNSDSSSNKSEKSDKSRKYENEPSRDSSSQAVTPYEVIKTTDESKQHQYVKLRTSTS